MSQAVADSVRDYPLVIAVGNVGLDLAPWAHALVAQDRQWWREYPHARNFAGRKFSTRPIDGVEQIVSVDGGGLISSQSNSGALALMVAHKTFGATDIELHGFDMHGSHYFGAYAEPLRNTPPTRFNEFQHQFAAIGAVLKKAGVRVVNRTPNSALRCFPFE
jgi:hypothetical protein